MESLGLVHFDMARRALAEASTLDEVKCVRDQAEAMRLYLKQQSGSHEMQNHAAAIKLRAERRLGEMLSVTPLHRGGRNQLHDVSGSLPTLAAIGVTPIQSHRWQLAAAVPEPVFEQHIERVLAQPSGELTSAAVVKMGRDYRRGQPADDAPANHVPDGLFTTIVADPPWRYSNVATRAAAEDHYPTLSIDELCGLEVNGHRIADMAADAAHLYLWTTNSFLREAFSIIDAWGFEYKTGLVWVKPQLGIGNYFRSSHEYVLFGVRGGLHVRDSNQRSWFEVPRGRHSRKPDVFYDLVEKVSPGPYLELFARTDLFGPRDGWTPWGNQA